MRIVVIGGSIVNGFPVREKDSWVNKWAAETGHEIINKGVNGSTADDILKRFPYDVVANKPDCAVMLFGTKDIATKGEDVEQVFEKLQEMVNYCRQNNIRPVVGVPLLIDEPAACASTMEEGGIDYQSCIDAEEANEKMRQYRAMILAAAQKEGFDVIDLQNEFQRAIGRKDPGQFYADGLKLNAKGHKIIHNIIQKSGLYN